MRTYLDKCPCGSGKSADLEFDARGYELGFMCAKCRKAKLAKYRPEVLSDPGYEADEPFEED